MIRRQRVSQPRTSRTVRDGFTLIELMVAMMIFTVGVLAMMS